METSLSDLLKKIESKDVLELKTDLIGLYNREVFERTLYNYELRKFEGEEFETVKWLAEQEETHVNILEQVLNRGNIRVEEEEVKLPKLPRDNMEVIKYDVDKENEAVKAYTGAINKSKGAVKIILSQIMGEEMVHIDRLRKFVK
jgi:rubrerythrin